MAENPRPTPSREPGRDVTLLLEAIGAGQASPDDLLPLVYEHLRRCAKGYFRSQRPDHTLQATALVHEAFVRLVGNESIEWESRSHFLAVASMAMRRVLADHARQRRAEKRGGDWARITLSGLAANDETALDTLDLDDALTRLAAINARQAQIVELRFFGGLTVAEAAHVLDVSPRTVELDWRMARAWLRRELGEDAAPGSRT